MSELTSLGAAAIGAGIQAGEFSPTEVTQAFLDRIARINERLNAFVTLTADAALDAAKRREAELTSGQSRGLLHGVPIGHKDLYYTKGVRTTAGSAVHADFVPDFDATVVQRLDEAGTIMLGKLNTHEFAYGPTNDASYFGPCRNPWDPDYFSGGSSGGSGSAVAARLLPAATGSDTGGSIRMPAACCGVTGLKPTYGRVSRHGIFPLCWTMDHAGPLARSVEDCALLLESMAGADPADAACSTRVVEPYHANLDRDLAGVRIGIPRRFFFDRAQADVDAAVTNALAELESLGAVLVDVDIPYIEHAASAAMAIYLAEAVAYHDDQLDDDPSLYTEQVRSFIELGNQVLAKDYLHAQRYRTLLGQSLSEVMRDIDVLATPGTPITAAPIGVAEVDVRGEADGVFGALLRNTEPFDLTGVPALVMPCGFAANGMPVSLQLVTRAFDELTALQVGHRFQQATDWHLREPGL